MSKPNGTPVFHKENLMALIGDAVETNMCLDSKGIQLLVRDVNGNVKKCVAKSGSHDNDCAKLTTCSIDIDSDIVYVELGIAIMNGNTPNIVYKILEWNCPSDNPCYRAGDVASFSVQICLGEVTVQ